MDITTPCASCAAQARRKNSPFFASRGLDWPLAEVAGHPVHRACASEIEHLARTAADGTLAIDPDGTGRWTTNGSAIPPDCAYTLDALGLAPGLDLAATARAYVTETAAFLKSYRDNQPAFASGEELAEMRAAFGPGATVVNAITGRTTQL